MNLNNHIQLNVKQRDQEINKMFSDQELFLSFEIYKEIVRISSFGGDLGSVASLISTTDVNTYSFADPNVLSSLRKSNMKWMLAGQLKTQPINPGPGSNLGYSFRTTGMKPDLYRDLPVNPFHDLPVNNIPKFTIDVNGKSIWVYDQVKSPFRPNNPQFQKQVEDVLKGIPKKLPVPTDPSKLTPEQLKLIRQLRFQSIRKRLTTSAGLSAGLSVVFNIGDLIKGDYLGYLGNVAKDTGISAGSSLLGVVLEDVPFLAEGSGVIIMGIIDAVKALNTGDWKRFGLNLGMNTCATASGIACGKIGTALGSWFPGPGNVIGGILGFIIGSVGAKLLAGKTRLGKATEHEISTAIRDKYNEQFRELGLELDPKLTLQEIMEQSEKGKFQLITTSDLTGRVTAETIKSFIPEESLLDLGQIATRLSPSNREQGLKMIYETLKKVK